MKTILVTGAAGFIGSNLVKRLYQEVPEAQVIGIDNMNDYYDVRLKEQRLNELLEYSSFIFIKGNIADKTLKENGFEYLSSANINNEYFPSREYDGVVFPADYYDALIVNLGNGSGNNWWCVAYPPLCFVGEDTSEDGVKYKSKILELINKFMGE